jgi:hypothetical protein
MLPFLKPKHVATTIMARVKPEGGVEHGDHKLLPLAEKLVEAIYSKDAHGVASILEKLQETDNATDEEQK